MWPQPAEFQEGSSLLWLAPDIQLRCENVELSPDDFQKHWAGVQQILQGFGSSQNKSDEAKVYGRIQAAFGHIKSSILTEHYVPDKFYGINDEFDPDASAQRTYVREIVVRLHGSRGDWGSLPSEEAYTLEVSDKGDVEIQALSEAGVRHAMQSFRQLCLTHSDTREGVYIPNAPIRISDSPTFEHRGLNLDIARNRIYPKDVLRTIAAMAAVKLNRLHLHATDSQSWPLDIPSIPELAKNGAYHKSQIWSASAFREVQSFGDSLGIEVFVEIDMPGHAGSIAHSFPELTVAYGKKWDLYAVEPPAGQLQLKNPDVKPFLSRLLGDLLERSREFSSKFHVGCDELNLNAYTLEPGLETGDKNVLKPYVQEFFDHVFKVIADHGLTPVGWEEILLDWDLDLPPSMILQSWRSQESLERITSRGYRALFGPSSHWYLDCGFGTFADPDPNNPNTSVKPPFQDWCPPLKNWRQVYSYDPLDGIPDGQKHLVIGGEAHLWGELVDSTTLDFKLWPRVAAAAEVLWRGKRVVNEDATRRLAEVRERLVSRGIAAGMVQMEWCLKNPGGCFM